MSKLLLKLVYSDSLGVKVSGNGATWIQTQFVVFDNNSDFDRVASLIKLGHFGNRSRQAFSLEGVLLNEDGEWVLSRFPLLEKDGGHWRVSSQLRMLADLSLITHILQNTPMQNMSKWCRRVMQINCRKLWTSIDWNWVKIHNQF